MPAAMHWAIMMSLVYQQRQSFVTRIKKPTSCGGRIKCLYSTIGLISIVMDKLLLIGFSSRRGLHSLAFEVKRETLAFKKSSIIIKRRCQLR